MNLITSLKTYWSILKTLLNNKKISCVLPLLQDNKYITDSKRKAELFNLFFAKQCSIIDNSSELPSNFLEKTDKSISAITFTCNDIATLIKNLDPNKVHGHDTSLFSVINDKHLSANKLNQDLNRINNWAFQWKMSFNPDPSKHAQKVIFSRKLQKSTHPTLSFNNNTVTQSVTQKCLGMLLDTKLDFQGHLKSIFNTVN